MLLGFSIHTLRCVEFSYYGRATFHLIFKAYKDFRILWKEQLGSRSELYHTKFFTFCQLFTWRCNAYYTPGDGTGYLADGHFSVGCVQIEHIALVDLAGSGVERIAVLTVFVLNFENCAVVRGAIDMDVEYVEEDGHAGARAFIVGGFVEVVDSVNEAVGGRNDFVRVTCDATWWIAEEVECEQGEQPKGRRRIGIGSPPHSPL